jgi:predicted nucleic acid-binding protein
MQALAEQVPLRHRRIPLVDLLVAAAAESAEVPVLHYDRHFERIAEITGQPLPRRRAGRQPVARC